MANVAVDPIRCATAADGLAGLREIFGCDAQLVGIVRDVAMCAVIQKKVQFVVKTALFVHALGTISVVMR